MFFERLLLATLGQFKVGVMAAFWPILNLQDSFVLLPAGINAYINSGVD